VSSCVTYDRQLDGIDFIETHKRLPLGGGGGGGEVEVPSTRPTHKRMKTAAKPRVPTLSLLDLGRKEYQFVAAARI